MLICSAPERCAEVFTIIQPLFIAKITFQTFVGCVSNFFQKLTDVCESISEFWKAQTVWKLGTTHLIFDLCSQVLHSENDRQVKKMMFEMSNERWSGALIQKIGNF